MNNHPPPFFVFSTRCCTFSSSFQCLFRHRRYNEQYKRTTYNGCWSVLKEDAELIEVKHLTKRYGNHTAVDDLSFTVDSGQIYGFLGPNGAGKSTTMNILAGCLAASSGEVKIGGYDIFEQAAQAKRLIGYLPEQPPLYLDRTPREYLTFVARAKRITEHELKQKIDQVMAVTQIADVSERLIRNLSKGYKQRVGIAQAILGDPEIVILDVNCRIA